MPNDQVDPPPAAHGRFDTEEKDSFSQWFEAIDARFRASARKWAYFNGILGLDAENLAVDAMTDLAKRLTVKGEQIGDDTDWDGVRAQLVTAVRNKALNDHRGAKRKPGNVGRGEPGDEKGDWEIIDPRTGETWTPTNIGPHLGTTLREAAESVRREVGEQAWGAFTDVNIRELPAIDVAEKRGYTGAKEVYRACEKVVKVLRKRLAEKTAQRLAPPSSPEDAAAKEGG